MVVYSKVFKNTWYANIKSFLIFTVHGLCSEVDFIFCKSLDNMLNILVDHSSTKEPGSKTETLPLVETGAEGDPTLTTNAPTISPSKTASLIPT